MARQAFILLLMLVACTAQAVKPKKMKPAQIKTNAQTAMSKRDYSTAIKLWNKLIKLQPNQLNYHSRADAYFAKKDYSHGIADLGRALEQDPKFVKAYKTRAKYALLSGDCALAVADYKNIIAIKPKFAAKIELLIPAAQKCATHVQLAEQYRQSGNHQRAIEELGPAIEIAHESNVLLRLRSELHLAVNDFQSVLIDTRQILKSDKNDLDALFLRGRAYYLIGDHEVAVTHFREGLKLAPEHKGLKEAYKSLRTLTKVTQQGEDAMHGDPVAAAAFFGAALLLDPDNVPNMIKIYIRQCEAYTAAKDGPSAIGSCQLALSHENDNKAAVMALGEARLVAGEFEQAIRDFERAINIQNSNDAQEALRRAKLQLKMSQRKDYYKILGVSTDADERTIKKEFRKLALKWHPDKHTGDEEKQKAEVEFREIAEAYEVLSDAETRGKFDRGEDLKPPQQRQHQHFHGQQFHFKF